MKYLAAAVLSAVIAVPALAQTFPVSPNGVKTLAPAGAIKPTGTWNLGTRAGDFVFVAGMRGIDPKTNALVAGDEQRVQVVDERDLRGRDRGHRLDFTEARQRANDGGRIRRITHHQRGIGLSAFRDELIQARRLAQQPGRRTAALAG
ncbi:MAG: hypothetical protein ACO25R_03085, partial [Burkholderiaceae bacterium]